MNVFGKYLLSLGVYTFVVALLAVGLLFVLPEKFQTGFVLLAIQFAFFFVTTSVLHYILLKSSQGRPQESIRAFTAGFAIKLFLYMGVLLVYRLANKEGFFSFAVWFLFLYTFYLVYEASALLKHFKN